MHASEMRPVFPFSNGCGDQRLVLEVRSSSVSRNGHGLTAGYGRGRYDSTNCTAAGEAGSKV